MTLMTETLQEEYQGVVSGLLAKSAEDVVVLDMSGLDAVAGAFVLATANSDVHMQTLQRVTEEKLNAMGLDFSVEGARSALWSLVDAGSVVVHIFSRKGRDFYRLENIWGDATVLHFEEESSIE